MRSAVGVLLASHGAQKLFGWFGGHGLAATESFFAARLGLPASVALLAGLIELGCGLLLALGLATRVAAVPVLLLMTTAFLHAHFGAGVYWAAIGYEEPMLWIIVMLCSVVRDAVRSASDAEATLMSIQASRGLVARLAIMPWYRAKMPVTTGVGRRRVAGRSRLRARAFGRHAGRRVK